MIVFRGQESRRLMKLAGFALAALLVGLVSGRVVAQESAAERSLVRCQGQVGKESMKLAAVRQAVLVNCLQWASRAVVGKQSDPEAIAEDKFIVSKCIRNLRKLVRTDGRSLSVAGVERIRRKCDPSSERFSGAHTLDDILGVGSPSVVQPLSADAVANYCGPVAFESVTDWISCIESMAECQAHSIVAASVPRSAEWLGKLETGMHSVSSDEAMLAGSELSRVVDLIDAEPVDVHPDLICGPGSAVLEACRNELGSHHLGLAQCLASCAAESARFPQTGQRSCFDGTNEVSCPGVPSGQDGEVRAGAERDGSFVYNGDGTISDLITGLDWETKNNDGGIRDRTKCFVWAGQCSGVGAGSCGRNADCPNDESCVVESGDACPVVRTIWQHLDDLNDVANDGANCFAGYCDWRAPSVIELHSIVDHSRNHPATYPIFRSGCTAGCSDCRCNPRGNVLTSTPFAGGFGYVWQVSFSVGSVWPVGISWAAGFLAVRGSSQ